MHAAIFFCCRLVAVTLNTNRTDTDDDRDDEDEKKSASSSERVDDGGERKSFRRRSCGKIREDKKGEEIPSSSSSVGQRQSSSRGRLPESVPMLTPHKRLMFHDFYYSGIEMEIEWRRPMTHFGGKIE